MKQFFISSCILILLAGCKAPVSGPTSVQIFDTDPTDAVGGSVVVGRPADETDITEYVLRWGSGSECGAIGADLAKLPKASGVLQYSIPAGTTIPDGAQTLMAFSKNASGTNKACAETNLYDPAPATVTLGKLEWMRCSLGQTFSGGHCINSPTTHWYSELPSVVAQVNNAGVAGRNDWRAPTIAELATIRVCTVNAYGDPTTPSATLLTLPDGSIAFEKCEGPYQFGNPKIDEVLFPDAQTAHFISADQYWFLNFENGGIISGSNLRAPVRLVRDVE